MDICALLILNIGYIKGHGQQEQNEIWKSHKQELLLLQKFFKILSNRSFVAHSFNM